MAMFRRRIKIRIEPMRGGWIVNTTLPGATCKMFVGVENGLTKRAAQVRVFHSADDAYRAVERLSVWLEGQYPGLAQEWDVGCFAREVKRIVLG